MDSQLVFEKVITRDWSLIFAENLHEAYTKEFAKQLGWQYTETVFEGKENTITVYRSLEEHVAGLTTFVLQNLAEDSQWMEKQAAIVKKQVANAQEVLDTAQKIPLQKYTSKKLGQLLQEIAACNIEFHPRYVIMLWFPIHMEKHPNAKKYAAAISSAITARSAIDTIEPRIDALIREIATELMRRENFPLELARYVSLKEACACFMDGKKIKKAQLLKRQKYFLITNKGIVEDPVDTYLQKAGFAFKKESSVLSGIIKGSPAYVGIARGKAKIILNKNMFAKFEVGDVLVAPMTTVDYAPLLAKAVAIVTDEGGITCHAAIVARELKKPCVIGTKNATRVLADGDLVEVNATKGIVTIIEKKK